MSKKDLVYFLFLTKIVIFENPLKCLARSVQKSAGWMSYAYAGHVAQYTAPVKIVL